MATPPESSTFSENGVGSVTDTEYDVSPSWPEPATTTRCSVVPEETNARVPLDSSIEHAIVEYAGGEGRTTNAGIVVTARTVAHLSLAHVTFRSNASRGLYVYDVDSWAGGNDLVFRKNGGLSFDGDPDVLAETKGLDVDEPIHVWGVATRPLVMPRAPAIRVRRLIVDGQKGSSASVTFPEGSIVKMDAGGEIKIGSAFPGHECGFTARNVSALNAGMRAGSAPVSRHRSSN